MQTKKWKIKAAVLCLCVGVFFAVPFWAELALGGLLSEYEIIDIGSLGGHTTPVAVNEAGQVAGSSHTPYTPVGFSHAFLWDPINGMLDLGTFPGKDYSSAIALNDYGVVVGSSGGSDEMWPFIWDSVNGMRYLEGLKEGCEGGALGINNAGQVVGIGGDGESCGGFLWSGGSVTYFDRGVGTAINNAGQVAGNTADGAFIWDSENGMRDLGTLSGYESRAEAISDAGQVVGWLDNTSGPWDPHAFLWEAGSGMIDLGPGRAWGVNDSGQVVGSMNKLYLAFYWGADTGMIRLDELLVSDSGWLRLCDAWDINNRGQIVGIGITDNGERRAFLMTPVGLKTIYVDHDAPGANDGSSWADAYNYLQDALTDAGASAKPIEIHVATGIYEPDQDALHPEGTCDREATFQLINNVTLRGGYAGFGGPDPNARDFVAYETILSGDIGAVADFSDNSYHIVQGGDNAILEGFTVLGGNANGSFQGGYGIGGGLYNDNCRLVVANCTFEENAAFNGGAIFSSGGTLAVHESIFTANFALQGGALVNSNGQMTLTRCVLSNNADGTIFCFGNGALQVESCVLDNNYGGWHAIDRSGTGSVIEVINSLFTHNAGGAISSAYNSLLIVNSALVDNNTTTFGGGVCCSYGSLSAVNCIMWGNTAEWGGDEIFGADATTAVSYSCIAGGYPGTGNINMNPLFRAPASEDYHLLAGSPCINAGDNTPIPPVMETDLDGKPRVIGGRIDMGAYEYPVELIEVPMKFTPQALNCHSGGRWVRAHFVLPAGFTADQVDSDTPGSIESLGIESDHIDVFVDEDGLVGVKMAFDRTAFCDALTEHGAVEITVTGSLTNGQQFYGVDTIVVIGSRFENLAALSSHWLQADCNGPDWCGGLDLDRRHQVDFKDFGLMALHWLENYNQ